VTVVPRNDYSQPSGSDMTRLPSQFRPTSGKIFFFFRQTRSTVHTRYLHHFYDWLYVVPLEFYGSTGTLLYLEDSIMDSKSSFGPRSLLELMDEPASLHIHTSWWNRPLACLVRPLAGRN